MPIYEYECKHCKFRIEKIQKINDPPLQYCSKCNGPLKKIMSSPNIRFKGSGWYVTDYSSNKSNENAINKENAKEAMGDNTCSKDDKQLCNNNNSSPP